MKLELSGEERPGFELYVAGFESFAGMLINALLASVTASVAWIVWTQFSPGFDETPLWTATHWGFVALLTSPLLLATVAGLKGLLVCRVVILLPDLSGLESVFRLGGVTISRRRWSLADFDHVGFRFLYGGYKSATRHEVTLIGPTESVEFTCSRSRSDSISFALWLGDLTGLPVQGIPEEPAARPVPKPVPIIRTVQELKADRISEDPT